MPHFREPRSYCAYMMGSLSGTLYVGVTGNLHRRVFEHKSHQVLGFTDKYGVTRLLYWEPFRDVRGAIAREKQLKGWRREKKIALIHLFNPHWVDLARAWYPCMAQEAGRGASAADALRCAKFIPRSA